jgi:glyoxylase-like metal-dependent hydrolase (beta-lactamase superfamily II)
MLLVEGERKILFEAGIGVFFPPKLKERFGVVEEEHCLIENLRELGHEPEDIDVIVLSHLHFDHAGGLLMPYAEGEAPRLAFPNASYVVGRAAWERALQPHARDRASFIPELPGLLEATGRLAIAEGERCDMLGDRVRLHYSEGHTPGLMLAELESDEGGIVFAGDLIPGRPWVHLPITMGYDRYPERLIDEKRDLLEDLVSRGGRLFFTHDHACALGRVAQDERGRYGVTDELSHAHGLALD